MKKSWYSRTAAAALLLCVGIAACLMVGAAYAGNSFTIAVISDTQNYVDVTHTQPFNEDFFISQTSIWRTTGMT